MKPVHIILLVFGLSVGIFGCNGDQFIDDIHPSFSENDTNSESTRAPCSVIEFCVQLHGLITSDATSVENCVTNRSDVLAVSPSAGDNGPMIANISALQPGGCFEIISGVMAIHEEKNSDLGRMEYYFTDGNGVKYALVTRGVISGDAWLPIGVGEEALVDFSGMEWEINTQGKGKGKKGAGDPNPCVASGVFPLDPPTYAVVQNGACSL